MAPWLLASAVSLAKEFIPSMIGKITGDTGGKVAEQVIDVAASMSGIDIKGAGDVDAAAEALRLNPELALQFQTRLAELEADITKAYLADRGDARERDVELVKAGKMNLRADVMVFSSFLAVVVIAVFLITADKIDPGVLGFLTTIGGIMMKNISTAFDFEFGSSRSSKGKSEDMGNMLRMLSGQTKGGRG